MDIKYFGLGSNLKEILVEEFRKDEKNLYVFENTVSFFEIKKEYLKLEEALFYNFKILNMYDFYEKLFKTDKIVLREEKQVILFYNSLTDEIKKELKINNYYDVIDLAYNFYSLFSELQEYKINYDDIKLEKWQEKTFKTLLKINNEIRKKVQEKGIILPYMLRKSENLSKNFIKKYKKICFINKVKFTPFEKEVIQIIKNYGVEVENILLLDKKYYDEKNLKIRDNFELPEKSIFEKKYNVNIEIYEFENKFSQLLGMVKRLDFQSKLQSKDIKKSNKEEKISIYDASEEQENNEKDYQLLNQNKITYNLEITMKKTKIYKVLDLVYNIIENIKVINKNNNKLYLFKMRELYNAFKSKEFLEIFDLKKSYGLFQDLVKKEYKYISYEKLNDLFINNERYIKKEKEINLMIKFIQKLEEIISYKTLNEYAKFLEDIFNQSKEKDNNVRDKYFEALSEMVVLEDFSFDNLWDKFFNKNVSASLLKLFLKYLDKKSISLELEKMEEETDKKKYTIKSFSSISETKKENIIFLNLQDSFPKVKVNEYLFSQIQRAKLKLPLVEEEKKIEIFKFYQNILSANNVYLSYVKNIDEKIDSSGLIEEIKSKYDIKSVNNEMSEQEELNFIKKYFSSQEENKKSRKIGKFIKSKLEKNKEKMQESVLNLGFYDFEKLKNSEYSFYIEKMIGDIEKENIEEKISPLIFGNIIHILYEKIIFENKENLEKGEFIIDEDKIKKTLDDILNFFEYIIPKEYITFYRKISFTEIVKSVKIYLQELYEYVLSEKDVKIHLEEDIKSKLEKEIYKNVSINGKVDLHIETKDKEILVDYKSGKDTKENKIRAFNQLNYYFSILPEKDKKTLEKWVINTWNGEKEENIEIKEEEIFTRENIKKVIKKYYETDYYDLGDKKDKSYEDIARREDELSDE